MVPKSYSGCCLQPHSVPLSKLEGSSVRSTRRSVFHAREYCFALLSLSKEHFWSWVIKLLESSNELARKHLERLNVAEALGRFRRWKSLRQVIKRASSKREVDDMADRLSMYRA